MNPHEESDQHRTSSGLEVDLELGHVPRKKKVVISSIVNGNGDIDVPQDSEDVAKSLSSIPPKVDNPIPRKKRAVASVSSTDQHAEGRVGFSNSCIQRISEEPFVLKIYTKGLDMAKLRQQLDSPRPSGTRSSTKGYAKTYMELENSDSDDYKMTEEEEQKLLVKRMKRKRTLSSSKAKAQPLDASTLDPLQADASFAKLSNLSDGANNHYAALTAPVADTAEAPPPGTLSTLWYSRECFNHVWVLEKICGWKTRPKFSPLRGSSHLTNQVAHVEDVPDGIATEASDTGNAEVQLKSSLQETLDLHTALKIQQAALQSSEYRTDSGRRMEISRINPMECPVVQAIHAESKSQRCASGDTSSEDNPSSHDFIKDESDREEVLLVKWRGRSHYHCSWERVSDIERCDVSNNSTSRNKIRRFFQLQEGLYGPQWKQALEEERKTTATMHHHSTSEVSPVGETVKSGHVDVDQVEEYFSPQCLMVERILACDESEMNMDVLAKQRALNLISEQVEENVGDEDQILPIVGHDDPVSIIRKVAQYGESDWDVPYDPEDNVRYVVKWKGLPYADVTWEYWRDIKNDAVDEVEDFWYRQVAPDLDEVKQSSSRRHPHIREFKKLKESPSYGVSKKLRPVLKSDGKEFDSQNDPVPAPTEGEMGFRLRSYQLEGLNWLLFNWWNRRSCILADEMGLGKTIQSAAFLQELQAQPAAQVRGPFLIVAPLSLIEQWQSELHSWAPDMNVVLYHGSADARSYLVQQEFYFAEPYVSKSVAVQLKKFQVTKFHVLITTYEVALKDISVLSKIRWRVLIVDEAHRLKNHKARLFEELATVPRDHCVLLTGTPIANATEELWSLLNFANPTNFSDRDDFLAKFGEMTDAQQVSELHAILKPYLLRRVKEDVEKSLPNKEETILEVSLTPIQKTFYKAIYERNTSFLFKGSKPNNTPSLMNVMMELRKCCNHPFLVKGAEDRILSDAATKAQSDTQLSGSLPQIDHVKLYSEQLVKSSGKMVLMEKLLQKLFDGGHKVLVFSQMVRVLDLLEDLLKIKKYRFERLDGTTSSSARLHAVERFKKKECNRFVMLLSTRAGGLGLNLTVADIVIIFDSDWNPQNDMQAMARAHRIGQTRAVKVYRFLTAKTYEMHMFHSASLKLGLERAVMSQNREQSEENEESTKSSKKNIREAQAKEIDQLLKKGAYDVFRDDDDTEAKQFMESDIDQLLERSSKTVSYGASATSSLGSGLGSFSKASFVASTEEGTKDVDLDDPDFWSKAVGLDAPPEETPEDIAAMLDDGVKRSRKQVEQYDPYAEIVSAEQLKKDRIALEKMLEREEKDRLLEEKRSKSKKVSDEKHKVNRDDKTTGKKAEGVLSPEISDGAHVFTNGVPKLSKDAKPKKGKAKERARAQREAEKNFPLIEQFKQAWEIPQRNRATAAAVRFGFGRFCKLRNESNLSSIPLQDLEVFVRSYCFQLSLQVAVQILSKLRRGFDFSAVRSLVIEWLGVCFEQEVNWICDALRTALMLQGDVENCRAYLRVPVTLTEPIFVEDLRHGAGHRALRRIGLLARLNGVIEEAVDAILFSVGPEELGKRGCIFDEVVNMDLDLKARFVSIEELTITLGTRVQDLEAKGAKPPALWWDRCCDIALLLGTFIHGLSNYESMRRDRGLPFGEKISRFCRRDIASKFATERFRCTSVATRQVFDDALESGRIKAELEVQAAVAAAAKAALQREEDAALLRKGGLEAEGAVRNMPDTQVDDAFEFDGTDTHFVTLPRMHEYILRAARNFVVPTSMPDDGKVQDESVLEVFHGEGEGESRTSKLHSSKVKEHHLLPMPDSRVLDYRLLHLLDDIEKHSLLSSSEKREQAATLWKKSSEVEVHINAQRSIFPCFDKDATVVSLEYCGIGLSGNQCGISHRTLNDGSDFSFGSASNQISQLAYGTDAPRYLRALGVPMNVTRFAISGLLYSDFSCVRSFIMSERLRYFGKEDVVGDSSGFVESNKPLNSSSVDETWMHSSSRPKVIAPIDPVELIDVQFRFDAKLRAAVCCAVGFLGLPLPTYPTMNNKFCAYMKREGVLPDTFEEDCLFTVRKFRNTLHMLDPSIEVPVDDTLQAYVESVLLPHCLRLCVNGNGPSTRNARGSHGDYETSFGISIHPEPSLPLPSPLPDPCQRLQEHSLQAVGFANAMLRRVRLLRTCVYLCSEESEILFDRIVSKTKSNIMGNVDEMPLWWCPWVHDVALLHQAGTRGLFSIFLQRSNHEVFSTQAIESFIRSKVITNRSFLPRVKLMSSEQLTEWIEQQALCFPSLYQLERRLGLLCGEMTSDVESEFRFDFIPMFDHGGWPRK